MAKSSLLPNEPTLTSPGPSYEATSARFKIAVIHASLHQSIVWGPAGINTEKTLSAQKTPGVKMWWANEGLLLEKSGKTAVVPSANVAIAVFE